MTGEWVDWHRGYEGDHPHARRLRLVQARIREALGRSPPGEIRVLSMCAGDGRDLLGVLPDHPRRDDVRARLVDLTSELVTAGQREISRQGLAGVEFVCADAGVTTAFTGGVPADLVLACGVFGNVSDADVHRTVRHFRDLCAPGATVIWTRGRFAPDLTPVVREWFRQEGFAELAFDTIPGTTASVGVHRLRSAPRRFRPGLRLFSFLPKEQRPSQRGRADPGSKPGGVSRTRAKARIRREKR